MIQLHRNIHPGAWWLWAMGCAWAASRTLNPLLLLLLISSITLVVVLRRSDAPWARIFNLYLILGLAIVVMRIAYRIIFGGGQGATVIVDLPSLTIPGVDVVLFGPISVESLEAGAFDGLRLAAIVICIGAANSLSDTRRLLKSIPGALYGLGTAITVALSAFPQLAESVSRTRKARRLRGGSSKRHHIIREVLVPVLSDALDRSLDLSAAMESRGFGRRGTTSRSTRVIITSTMMCALVALALSCYGVLDAHAPFLMGWPLLIVGCALGAWSMLLGGRTIHRTRYRPDPWKMPEWIIAAAGICSGVAMSVALNVNPDVVMAPIGTWPQISALTAIAMLLPLGALLIRPVHLMKSEPIIAPVREPVREKQPQTMGAR